MGAGLHMEIGDIAFKVSEKRDCAFLIDLTVELRDLGAGERDCALSSG